MAAPPLNRQQCLDLCFTHLASHRQFTVGSAVCALQSDGPTTKCSLGTSMTAAEPGSSDSSGEEWMVAVSMDDSALRVPLTLTPLAGLDH